MNPLEKLKQKLMAKPTLNEVKPVVVAIQGQKKEGEVSENPQKEEPEIANKMIVVDETNKEYNRNDVLLKLAENKKTRVKVKPIMEAVEASKQKEPIRTPAPVAEQPPVKKAKKMVKKPLIIIEGDEEIENAEKPEKAARDAAFEIVADELPQGEEVALAEKKEPTKRGRTTKKVEKGIAVLGPENVVEIGDTPLSQRLAKKDPPVIIKVDSYYMNNREIFVNFINSLFEPYKKELEDMNANISCDTIGNDNKDDTSFSLLTHQKIVRDYMNLFTPYRGLLLYHGLGAGKTASSIAIAEGMKDTKKIIIMLPASLRTNYMEELKHKGDSLYKKNQYWEFISLKTNPEALSTLSAVLNLSQEYITKQKGAWFVNIKKPSNYEELTSIEKKSLDDQLNEMIRNKYTFINYNGLRLRRLQELTSGFTKNLFDNSVIIIDEAHNLISRIVNKIKKEKVVPENERGEKEYSPKFLSVKLYEYLMSAKNARVVMLTGTPIINYPNEFGILFNILRGYIKTWNFPLNVKTTKKIDRNSLQEMLLGEKSLDYLDYSPSSKVLTITRNPFGFKNKIKESTGYKGVSNVKRDDSGNNIFDNDFMGDDEFERRVISILKRNDIDIISDGIKIRNQKALPDDFDLFENQYIDGVTKKLKNVDALKRRIIGLSSYFKSAQESLLPTFNKTLGVDYHVVKIPMSDFQFKIYESARKEERKLEKASKKPQKLDELFKEATSTYRIFSRLYCNFVMNDRPLPMAKKSKVAEEVREAPEQGDVGEPNEPENDITKLLKDARKEEANVDVNDENEGEEEGDQILDKLGGVTYKERIDAAIKNIKERSNDYLTPEALARFSPKFLHILDNIKDPEYLGLHLVYSQFRTLEGIGLFSLVLEKNGFARFKIKKNASDIWEIDIPEADLGKPTYALYTGTETVEEKEITRRIYNGEWDYIPTNLASELRKIANNNNMGEIIKVLMITSSGSEGINLRNTRYVHIMEPYWHPVRTEQVIGRARRICSHKNLPRALQTVEVFVYLMVLSPEQLKSDDAIELKRKDLSKGEPKVPITTDQLLYEISEIKANLSMQLTDAIKESAFDCFIYSNGKCMNFGDPKNNKFSYVPDYANQQSDVTVRANKKQIEWEGKPITLNGIEYVYRRISPRQLNIYDKNSYLEALKNAEIIPVQIGTLEINEKGEQVFKQLVT
uniref:Helicase ATP-binding domain-containing protein n=1 Tax=viral metagenome TaxID=1070528 RepID=A0A6C0JFH6_9ZZZZ